MSQPYGYERPTGRMSRGLMVALAVIVIAAIAVFAFLWMSDGGTGSSGGGGDAGGYFVLALPAGLLTLRRRR